jgi:hypothetical protein
VDTLLKEFAAQGRLRADFKAARVVVRFSGRAYPTTARRAVSWLGKLNHWPAKATNEGVELGAHMHLRGNALRRSTPQNEDYHLAGAIGLVLAGYVGFFLYLYWLMQLTVSTKPELVGYRPAPKTVVRPADSPSILPAQPEALPPAEPASAMAKTNVTEKKKDIKRQGSERRGQQALAGRAL